MNVDNNPDSELNVLLNSLGLSQDDFAKKKTEQNKTKPNKNIKICSACGYIHVIGMCLTIIHIHGYNIVSQNSISPVIVTM